MRGLRLIRVLKLFRTTGDSTLPSLIMSKPAEGAVSVIIRLQISDFSLKESGNDSSG